MDWRERIEIRPEVAAGKPVIKGTRLSVEFIITLLAQGKSEQDVLRGYPHLTHEDILACLAYASEVLQSETVYSVTP